MDNLNTIRGERNACKKCGNKTFGKAYCHVFGECFSRKESLPTNVTDYHWVFIENSRGKRMEKELDEDDEKLRNFIINSPGTIMPDPSKNVVVIGDGFEIPVREMDIDASAERMGLLESKWLIYEPPDRINEVWKVIAPATYRNHLGCAAKVSTFRKSRTEFIICVYTNDYLDMTDVVKVGKRLMGLGLAKRLYYKPDIYTYLKIYSNTFLISGPSNTYYLDRHLPYVFMDW